MERREFLRRGVVSGAGAWLVGSAARAGESGKGDQLEVALIGVGEQGRALLNAAVLIPGIRFRALADIWKHRRRAAKYYLETYKQEVNEYEDYREMLDAEKTLDAVLIATPDFAHAEQTIACLQAGRHVYCEKMMSNSLEGARAMVRAMKATGRLLQIGYQRRSNSVYRHVVQRLLKGKLPGRITHCETRWGSPVREDAGWPKKQAIPDNVLGQYGYANMHEFRNWRFFKKFGAGPLGDFASQQLDVCRWALGALPRSVQASAGLDYYQGRQWHDNALALLEFSTAEGIVRGTTQVFTTTSGGPVALYEQFLGSEGTVRVSEHSAWTKVFREASAPDWDPWVKQGLLQKEPMPPEKTSERKPEDPNEVHVRETGRVTTYALPIAEEKPAHQPHLENFFDAIRGRAQLHCPADEAFATEVVVHKLNEAITARRTLDLKPEDFATPQ